MADARLPRPAKNIRVEGYESDAVWRAQRLIVEPDGRAVHGTRRAFEADRARDRALTVAGWRVIRITWRQLHRDRPALAGDLRRLVRADY
ncbi:MAG: endonuclease domain-containing protein [Actinomycetota bacterium]|nr:endonuclease domain-containing protein [Actinomycetota bacterium]